MEENKFRIFLAFLLFGLICHCQVDPKSKESVLLSFNKISISPKIIEFTNYLEVNNRGGHLQGIQLFEKNRARYAVLTGSSDSYSYCSVVKLGIHNEVISVNKLMDKPFKHAGGFQIFGNYMAVGIEDNSAKDKSKVCLFDILNPEKQNFQPIAVINRVGEPMRSTAGCVGITKYKDKMLVAVGDWDTKHIDLYSCKLDVLDKSAFEKIYSFELQSVQKLDWSDPNWWPYQNINLFTFNNDEPYLIGLGQNNKDENIADLYSLKEGNSGEFVLTKMASKTFDCRQDASFKAGAGIFLGPNGEFKIIACGYNIENTSFLNYFESVN